jgi:hypothetical protein
MMLTLEAFRVPARLSRADRLSALVDEHQGTRPDGGAKDGDHDDEGPAPVWTPSELGFCVGADDGNRTRVLSLGTGLLRRGSGRDLRASPVWACPE